MTTLPISVLIPTMNRVQSLKRTVDGFLSQEYIPSQIVVVDQSQSIEDQAKIRTMLSSYTETNIIYLYQQTPSSSAARNLALLRCNEEIIVFSDDDIDVNQNTLKNVYKIMQNPFIAMIAGIDENSAVSSTNIGYLLGTKSFKNRKIGHVTLSVLGRYPDRIVGDVDTQWAMGYFFVVRKSLVSKWNIKWDENLTGYAYAEDLDFSYSYYKHAKAEGLRCILTDKVKVRHLVSTEYRIPSKKSTYMYILNRAYLSHKHNMGFKSRAAMRWCNFWRTIERIIHKENPQDILEAKKYLRAHRNEIRKGIFTDT